MDAKNERLAQVIAYLKENRAIRNQQELSEMLEYDSPTLSMAKNGKCDVPHGLLIKINELFPAISLQWMLYGEGKMVTDTPLAQRSMLSPAHESNSITIPEDVWLVIKQQAASLERRDQQISQLIDIISNNKQEKKETLVG